MKGLNAEQVKYFENYLNSFKKELLRELEDTNNKIRLIEEYNKTIIKIDGQNVTFKKRNY